MPSNIGIINLGIGKYSSSKVSRIDPAVTPLEVFCQQGYPTWRQTELAKRRWVFAWVFDYQLTASSNNPDLDYPYTYNLPQDVMRPIREKGATWRQSKRTIQARESDLRLDYIRNVEETDFDPLFVDVLSCRIAIETVAFVTESTAKLDRLRVWYNEAVDAAAAANAFVIGPEAINSSDDQYPFLAARW